MTKLVLLLFLCTELNISSLAIGDIDWDDEQQYQKIMNLVGLMPEDPSDA